MSNAAFPRYPPSDAPCFQHAMLPSVTAGSSPDQCIERVALRSNTDVGHCARLASCPSDRRTDTVAVEAWCQIVPNSTACAMVSANQYQVCAERATKTVSLSAPGKHGIADTPGIFLKHFACQSHIVRT